MLKLAILDDYARVALDSADWSPLAGIAEITVFDRHLTEEEAASALKPFDVLCTVRERMALPRSLFEKLPHLKLVTIVGLSLPNLDMAAATDHGVIVVHSDTRAPALAGIANATPELAWGLMIATVRHLATENRRMGEGGWQSTVGVILAGRTLGLLGLGRIGKRMAEYAHVFGMKTIAWSQNLTEEAASAVGVRYVSKDALFREADILSIHVVLSERTRGLVTARELALMKPGAYLINTSRAPIVDQPALIETLRARRIAGAGIDVYDLEPPPADHPFRTMDNVTVTPHLGYVTRETLRAFYGPVPEAMAAFARGAPVRVANPDALKHEKQRALPPR
ncbi:D-2-hydroxyacid dehydrogenase family protein [Methylocapsa sp. S129]|uniref:D-2-hydroxyacid dehydrogenase family protein n=1 Tax=Methylocapsa sp. S129 TaxID=1641869 RepID=UPI00131AA678|nr:D-2-hydroxyacid dehydrogenase family protein [Methylocapsa sp. S129]